MITGISLTDSLLWNVAVTSFKFVIANPPASLFNVVEDMLDFEEDMWWMLGGKYVGFCRGYLVDVVEDICAM